MIRCPEPSRFFVLITTLFLTALFITTLVASLWFPMTLNASDQDMQLTTPEQTIKDVLKRLCLKQEFPFSALDTSPIESRGRVIGQRSRYSIQNDVLEVERIGLNPNKQTYRLTYSIHNALNNTLNNTLNNIPKNTPNDISKKPPKTNTTSKTLSNNHQPQLFVATDNECNIRIARRIIYKNQQAVSLQSLDSYLSSVIKEEAIKPTIPKGFDSSGVKNGKSDKNAKSVQGIKSIRVGIVDSGVNYLLPEISQHLARNTKGNMIGYDFWDLDNAPFDYNPSRSVFFPQRHGTRTASLLLKEAPEVSLVPYRYPRPDMSRMADLVSHAANNQVSLIAMPLGSKNKEEWLAFYHAAKVHPDILFIISSGNNGVNIDESPIYPASFQLDNLLVVSSADETPRPASRTNWGKKNVDILLPADRQQSIDFDGQAKMVSGTSYAVSRIAALAARIASRHPDWKTPQIKADILRRADKNLAKQYTAYGLLNDPLADTAVVKKRKVQKVATSIKPSVKWLKLPLNIILLNNSGWTTTKAIQAAKQAAEIMAACQINLEITLVELDVSDYLLDFHSLTSRTLIDYTKLSIPATPTIYLTRDTRRLEAFGGEAFGESNSSKLPWLTNTAWLIAEQQDPGIAIAHELFHILVDNGDHNTEPENLMNSYTQSNNIALSVKQCATLKLSTIIRSYNHNR